MIEINLSQKKIFTIPNILSLMRIILIAPFVIFMKKDNYLSAGLILLISGISDVLDGFIARKFHQRTRLGEMLDPAADKLTLITVMISVGIKFTEVIPFMILMIFKEFLMLSASVALLRKNRFPASAKWYGKVGTVAFYFSVIIIVSLKAIWNIENSILNLILMTITALLMFYALVKYFRIFIDMINNEERP